jgi:hypothetical protein
MLIPNAKNAVVDIRKLRDYCLNPEHDDGKQKARLFSSLLGMTADNAEELRQILLKVIQTDEAQLGRRDGFGQRYILYLFHKIVLQLVGIVFVSQYPNIRKKNVRSCSD